GIQVDTLENELQATLSIENTKIENMTSAGIYAQGSSIKASNCLIANCGQFAVALTLGGKYEFYHCTIANYWNYSTRSTPSLFLNNYYTDVNDVVQLRPLKNARFGNCIIYGNKENEITFDKNDNIDFNFMFNHCLLKIDEQTQTSDTDFYKEIIKNISPNFVSSYDFDFQLDTLSIAKDAGSIEIGQMFPNDINGNSRIADDGPDLGVFERIE
ncbi:MAG: right-handed parallel beta-helix repeat-containing protein, partial [Bacteroidota bacterium]|nr:right-handed parallel beta-helix repeat-containing protein [Bacteroidota bacterium]